MGKTNTQTYNYAKSFLGKGGSIFRKYCGLPSGAAWCNAFVTYIFHKTDNAKLYCNGKKQTYCPTSMKLCAKDMAQIPMYLAMPMDVIYFDWDRNGVPNHIGFVRSKKSTSEIYTIEGNTSNKVMNKTRPAKYVCAIFRPHFAPSSVKKCKLKENDINFGYVTIYNLQCALGMKPTGILTKETVKFLQKRAGAPQDGAWGNGTSKKVQKMVGAKADGDFGPASVKALKKWINNINYPPKKAPTTTKPAATTNTTTPTKKPPTTANKAHVKQTNTQKILAKAKELAWAYGTAKKKYEYKTGAPKAVCKKAMKKYGYTSKAEMSDCGNFVTTVVRESGVDKSFKALRGLKDAFPKSEKKFKIVLKGKAIPSGFLKAGDIVRYKKTNGHQHALIYYGDGKVCEASHKNLFGVIRKDTKRYNTQSKKKTIQVLRAK